MFHLILLLFPILNSFVFLLNRYMFSGLALTTVIKLSPLVMYILILLVLISTFQVLLIGSCLLILPKSCAKLFRGLVQKLEIVILVLKQSLIFLDNPHSLNYLAYSEIDLMVSLVT